MNNIQSISLFWPELVLVITAIVVIILDFTSNGKSADCFKWWAIAGIFVTFWILSSNFGQTAESLFFRQVAFDSFGTFFKQLILISTGFILFVIPRTREFAKYQMGEFFTLIIIMVFGMFLLVSAIDIIMVYLALEIVSITSFVLAGYMKMDKRSNEAALKYVIYGAFSSGLMLFGFSFLYGLTGTTNFHDISRELLALNGSANVALLVSAVLILAGFGYKISAVPFHFWTPDVYEGAPTPVTAFLSVAPKAAGFAVLIRFFNEVFVGLNVSEVTTLSWPIIIAVLSVATMTLGNLVALQQDSVKRMLAYSAIAHAGYMLMGIPILTQDGYFGIMIYLVMYMFMNLGAFFVVIVVQNRYGDDSIESFKELGWKMPFVGVVMMIFMLSLTGLPPTAGFIGKFYLFAAVIKAGPAYYWLVFAGIINSVISLVYYLRIVKVMFLHGTRAEILEYPSKTLTTLLVCLAVPAIILGVYWAPIADWVRHSLILFTNTV